MINSKDLSINLISFYTYSILKKVKRYDFKNNPITPKVKKKKNAAGLYFPGACFYNYAQYKERLCS